MPATTCIRCFAVFSSDDARPGAAPVCPACATVLAAAEPLPPARTLPPPRRKAVSLPVLIGAGLVLALAVAAAVLRFVL